MNTLLINPSDIYYMTGVRFHEIGECFIVLPGNIYIDTFDDKSIQNHRKKTNSLSSSAIDFPSSGRSGSVFSRTLESEIDSVSSVQKKGIIFCDPRTSALFDTDEYIIIDDRKKWEIEFQKYQNLVTDPDFLTQSLREKIEGYGVKFSFSKSPVTQKRVIKTPEEIEKLRISQKLNKQVYEKITQEIMPGVAEEAIARRIQILQLKLGADCPSFPPIVAFGEHTAVPHHSPTSRVLQIGEMVLIDMGLVLEGYCSDMTRMVYQNGIPDEARKIGELVTHVTQEIIQWARPGMKVAYIETKARDMLGEYAPYFTHSLGHGVGMDIHEEPFLSARSEAVLEPGMVITIEPGIYITGKYGARYEEMVLVCETGLKLL